MYLRQPALALGITLGILLPLIGMIVPVKRALTKTLRDALDVYHNVVFDTNVSIRRLQDLGLSVTETSIAVFLVTFGILVYYVIPLAFLFQWLNVFFRVLSLILLALVMGQILVWSALQTKLEKLVLSCIVFGSHRYLKDVILKNLQSHRPRNSKTTLMFAICLSYVIFAATMFTLQANSLSENQEWFTGADISVQGGTFSNPLPEKQLRNYLDQLQALNGTMVGMDIVAGFTFISIPFDTLSIMLETRLSQIRHEISSLGNLY